MDRTYFSILRWYGRPECAEAALGPQAVTTDASVIHCVRGQSGFFDLVLTERNMQIKFDLRLSVYSLGVDI